MAKVVKDGKININYEVLDALLQHKITKKFCAEYLGVSEDTLERRLREDFDMTFKEYHALKLQNTSYKLQQQAIKMALKGNAVMMIFCLKNLSGWSDKSESELKIKSNVEALSDDELKEIISSDN